MNILKWVRGLIVRIIFATIGIVLTILLSIITVLAGVCFAIVILTFGIGFCLLLPFLPTKVIEAFEKGLKQS